MKRKLGRLSKSEERNREREEDKKIAGKRERKLRKRRESCRKVESK
jgi:hypothetical protein